LDLDFTFEKYFWTVVGLGLSFKKSGLDPDRKMWQSAHLACAWPCCCPFQSVVKKTKCFLMNKEEKLKDYHEKLFIQFFIGNLLLV